MTKRRCVCERAFKGNLFRFFWGGARRVVHGSTGEASCRGRQFSHKGRNVFLCCCSGLQMWGRSAGNGALIITAPNPNTEAGGGGNSDPPGSSLSITREAGRRVSLHRRAAPLWKGAGTQRSVWPLRFVLWGGGGREEPQTLRDVPPSR